MPDGDTAAAGLAARLTAGDPAALAVAYREWQRSLRSVVRRELHDGLRSRVDSLDFVQDVWVAFLNRRDGTRFATDAQAFAYLAAIARNKIIDLARQRGVGTKDDRALEAPIEAYEGGAARAAAASPTPSQFAMADEAFDRLLQSVPPSQRAIVECLRQGYTNEDISRLTNVCVRTVDRVVKRIKETAEA